MKYSDLISFNPIEDVIQLTTADDANRAKEYVKSYAVMNIDDSGYYSFQELNDSVYLFPFKYHVEKETIVSDSRFSISTFGSELSISLT